MESVPETSSSIETQETPATEETSNIIEGSTLTTNEPSSSENNVESTGNLHDYPQLTLDPIPPPPPITITDLLQLKEVIQRKEDHDRIVCTQIQIPYGILKEKLFDWAVAGFPTPYEISRITIEPPNKCSDGITRNIYDYIVFLSQKSLEEHLNLIRAQVQGTQISASVQASSTVVIYVHK